MRQGPSENRMTEPTSDRKSKIKKSKQESKKNVRKYKQKSRA